MRKFVNFSFRLCLFLFVAGALLSEQASSQTNSPAGTLLPGQTATLLPDGRWLIAGGIGPTGPQNQAMVLDTTANTSIPVPGGLANARAGHTATVLPQGTVLILGGLDANGLVETPELFDPSTMSFQALTIAGPSPRAYHTATLLTEGRVVLAGGVAKGNGLLRDAELWDPQTGNSTKLPSALSTARRNQTAAFLFDGTVLLWGGFSQTGAVLQNGEIYDPQSQTFTATNTPPAPKAIGPQVEASLPANGATEVPLGAQIALRFSKSINVATVNSTTVTLTDESQTTITAKVVAAEGGMLAFLIPQAPLLPLTAYTVTINGPTDASNQPLTALTFTFTTLDDGSGGNVLTAAGRQAVLESTKEPTPLPALQSATGVTALSGRVLTSHNAQGLAGVGLDLMCAGTKKAVQSDNTGRFLISGVPSGHCKLEIDGTNTAQKGKYYGIYFVGVDLTAGQTNVLPYFIWLTQIDTSQVKTIPSPTKAETVVTTRRLPGLQLDLQPNTVITDYDGNVVTQLGITQIPLGRPPFPLPNVLVDFYFTIQPGGGYVKVNSNGVQGARLIYPNAVHAPAGTRFDFWNYDPDQKGWYVYGEGSVSADARSIIPDPGVVIYSFTGAMSTNKKSEPDRSQNHNCTQPGCHDTDPVDLGTGLFMLEKTDLSLPGVMPIVLKRTYRQGDSVSRAFGVGASHSYNAYLAGGPDSGWAFLDLVLSDGSSIHYPQIAGSSWTGVFEHTGTQTAFFKSQINWNGTSFDLKFKDGTVWNFSENSGGTPLTGAIRSITDRNGNALTMTRDAVGNLTRVTSSDGRWISFNNDSTNRITSAQDNSGRTVSYSYDSGGRLSRVTDANGGITQYTYDPNNQLMTITDPRNITYLTNWYDSSGRVIEQDEANGGVFHLAYTLDTNGNIIQTDVTNPRGFVNRSVFDTSGYQSGGNLTSNIRAVGRPEQQTTSYQYASMTNLMLNSTDALGRQTTFAYDSSGCGNKTGVTRLAGTGSAVTTAMTYQPGSGTYPCLALPGQTATYNQITSVTDPLSNATTFGYDSTNKNLVSVTDPLTHTITISPNSDGQPGSITTFAGTTQFGYLSGDLVSITDPTNNTTRRTLDLAGRLVSVQAPLGQVTQYQYDAVNELVKTTDPLTGQTSFTYDGNGNPLTVQDANTHTTVYTPNNIDKIASRKDALLNQETYQYDLNGNPSVYIDRKNQVAQYIYDGLDRLTQVQYADLSTITYTYDAGNRVTQIVDTINGTITRGYDGLDRLTSETTPQGTITYTYDNANRRSTMTVAGQSAVNYTYDNANRLTQITQGTATVTMGYDNANRRTSLTLPNAVVVAYGYDAASRVTSITYTQGMTTIGNLTYTYDANGRRTSMGGSLARVNLPTAITSVTYNANNQLTNWNGTTLSYDLNGNMTYDGATNYTWDARNRLGAFGSTTFAYDSFGRRTRNAAGTAFLYDWVNAVQELSGSTVTANLLTGELDENFTRTDSAGARNFVSDALGSTLALTDSTGTVQTQYSYEPFGKTTASGAASTSTFQYTGRENDGTGLYYYRARYYNPTLQRFISEDPIGFAGGDVDLYSYAGNSSVLLKDALGLSTGAFVATVAYTAPFGLSGQFFFGIAFDNQGGFGTIWGGGGGLGAGAKGSASIGYDYSNGKNICDLGGPFTDASLGAGAGFAGSVHMFAGASPNGWVTGGGAAAGIGAGGAGSAGITGTNVHPLTGRYSCQ